MKKFVASLITVLALATPAQVLALDWVEIDEQLHIDADSIAVKKDDVNERVFWFRRTPDDSRYFFMIRGHVYCPTGSLSFLEGVAYNSVTGKPIISKKSNYESAYAVPSSIGGGMVEFVCKL